MIRAVALLSSGLDSLLAAKIVRDQGVDIHGLHCAFSFAFSAGTDRKQVLRTLLEPMGIPLEVLDVTEPFMDVMRHPQHGFGSSVNPCIDCHLFMLRQAKKRMEEIGARFVVTGEVVGQRPMSQNLPALFRIEKLADLKRLILRPLSAKNLPATIPEENGWVNREAMYGIRGRGRREQEALAARLRITRYFQPAGGCILTDPFFGKRVKMFLRNRGQENLSSEVLMLCRFGRHFWINDRLWVIVGRHEQENASLEKHAGDRWRLEAEDLEGPLAIADSVEGPEDLATAASILVRYVNKRKDNTLKIRCVRNESRIFVPAQAADGEFLEKCKV